MDLASLSTQLRAPDHRSDMLFLLPVGDSFPGRIVDFIKGELELLLVEYTMEEVAPVRWQGVPELSTASAVHALFVRGRKTETVRSILKAAFWPPPMPGEPLPYESVTKGERAPQPLPFGLDHAGWFFPATAQKEARLVCRSFEHRQIYRLRFDSERLKGVYSPLASYVNRVVENCPNHLFYMDGLRGSAFPGHVPVALRHEPRHEVCGLARDSHSVTRFRSRHENCQYHFLTEDPFTVGVEIPVWLESREILDFAEVFGGRGPLTGHIDLVREKSGVIEVWDYKPGAKRERTAATQVFLYTLMLSIRTGIPLKHFQCGYFDEHDCYTFSPLNLHILR